jgi:hypothetical protein
MHRASSMPRGTWGGSSGVTALLERYMLCTAEVMPMRLQKGVRYRRRYASEQSARRALRRFAAEGHVFSPEGRQALEMFALVEISFLTPVATTGAGAKIGSHFGGIGTVIGAAGGLAAGVTASWFIGRWYLRVSYPRTGGVVVSLNPR